MLMLSLVTSAVAKPARRHVAAARRSTSAPAPKRAPAPAPATTTTTTTTTETAAAPSESSDTAAPAADAKGATPATKVKTKTYTFGAMDVEGKLKTPQLLYFLNRVKLELDMSAPDKRSFMKELAQSADDKSL
jgi:hypothetical protein